MKLQEFELSELRKTLAISAMKVGGSAIKGGLPPKEWTPGELVDEDMGGATKVSDRTCPSPPLAGSELSKSRTHK